MKFFSGHQNQVQSTMSPISSPMSMSILSGFYSRWTFRELFFSRINFRLQSQNRLKFAKEEKKRESNQRSSSDELCLETYKSDLWLKGKINKNSLSVFFVCDFVRIKKQATKISEKINERISWTRHIFAADDDEWSHIERMGVAH